MTKWHPMCGCIIAVMQHHTCARHQIHWCCRSDGQISTTELQKLRNGGTILVMLLQMATAQHSTALAVHIHQLLAHHI